MKKRASKFFLIGIITILTIIPFFWMKPGELDIGGDGPRIYLYDPINFIRYTSLYPFTPSDTGNVDPQYFSLPFVTLFFLLNTILQSPHVLNVLHISLKLAIGFLAIYGIVREILSASLKNKEQKRQNTIEAISIISGLFYTFAPTIIKYNNYVDAIVTHDQVFLNPLIFFFGLRYLITKNIKYMWWLIFITFIFSHNFFYEAAPPIFSFYPFALLFLVIYIRVILKKTLPLKNIFIVFLIFILIHAFHLIPEFFNLLDSSSSINTRIFNTGGYSRQLQYFYAVLKLGDLSGNILQPSITGGVWFYFAFVAPFILILGFLRNKQRILTPLLTAVFLLITFFLLSAKVSFIGIKLYEWFFLNIPGFSMFRNFYVQWLYVFSFFYTLLFAQCLFILSETLNGKKKFLLISGLFIYIIGSSWIFINGETFNPFHSQTKQVGKRMIMDPKYEQTLSFFRSLPIDGKIFVFPFTDFNYQVIHGTGNGALVGSSAIGQLTGKREFTGYWHIAPFSDAFLESAQKKDYTTLKNIFGLLNVKYIFHNADPKIYDDTFFGRPYSYVRKFLPSSQKEYESFIKPLVKEKLFESGPYRIYSVDDTIYIPHLYVPKETTLYKYDPKYGLHYAAASSFILNASSNERAGFIEENACMGNSLLQTLCERNTIFSSVPKIYFKRINASKYIVEVKDIKQPFLLVLSEAFHKNWKVFVSSEKISEEIRSKIYYNGDIKEGKAENIFYDKNTFETLRLKSLPDKSHFLINGYANAWYIMPSDMGGRDTTFIVEMTNQKIFYFALSLSVFVLSIFMIWGFFLFLRKGKLKLWH